VVKSAGTLNFGVFKRDFAEKRRARALQLTYWGYTVMTHPTLTVRDVLDSAVASFDAARDLLAQVTVSIPEFNPFAVHSAD
jgi:hypothetical protein